jgi:hypothetical protein
MATILSITTADIDKVFKSFPELFPKLTTSIHIWEYVTEVPSGGETKFSTLGTVHERREGLSQYDGLTRME